MKRSATAVWQGSGKDGKGNLTTQSSVLNETQYSFSSRFENGIGTNPEELIAAAHAGCFSMKLSFVLGNSGFVPEELKTSCVITLGDGVVTSSKLKLSAKIEGIDEATFLASVKDAEINCPISKLLDTEISVDATLV
jgi:osmotically inducible protein OsmC